MVTSAAGKRTGRIRFGKRYKTIQGAFDALRNFKERPSLWYTSITGGVRTEYHLLDFRIEHNYNPASGTHKKTTHC